jgi:hypothetical protein
VWDEEFLMEGCISIFLSRSEEELLFLPEICCYSCVAKEDIFKSFHTGINKDI